MFMYKMCVDKILIVLIYGFVNIKGFIVFGNFKEVFLDKIGVL